MLTALAFTACQKENSVTNPDTATSASSTIAVAAVASVAATTDSVYLVQPCGRGGKRDSIAESALPATVIVYLQTNYSGYAFAKAFEVKNSTGNTAGYVAIIYFNDKPVGLLFDNTGTFVKVLEQREKEDMDGPGYHRGGRFEHRDGRQKDTIALASLPASVLSYFTANYASDTLIKAFKNHDSSYVVLSKNNGVFATVFDSAGNFVNRVPLMPRAVGIAGIEQSALPSAVTNYLSTTYPNYVFEKALSVSENGSIKGYLVLIDANNTKYAVAFDAAGNFLAAKTVQ
jgi:hypothetical protein